MGKFVQILADLDAKRVTRGRHEAAVRSLLVSFHALKDCSRILQGFPSEDRQGILDIIRRADTVQDAGDTGSAGQTPQRLS